MDLYSARVHDNLKQQDAVIIQLSTALLAITGAFGKPVLKHNVVLSVAMAYLLAITILQAILGYYLSDQFYYKTQKLLNKNLDKEDNDLLTGIDKIWEGRLNRFFNRFIFLTFTAAIICFLILIISYIRSL
jgi:hypothetical protein